MVFILFVQILKCLQFDLKNPAETQQIRCLDERAVQMNDSIQAVFVNPLGRFTETSTDSK